MAKKETTPKPEVPAYEMPAVAVGDIVLWHADPVEAAVSCAVVTEVTAEAVSCSLMHRNFYNMEPKDGVRHVDHPDKALIRNTDQGCWSHKPDRDRLEDRLAELEALIDLSAARTA